ncbi:MAG: PEP-utilizing enzyme [Candidatus Auribacterota bacterium]|nr:PEP-utilizing enzyme [Candidatus Auribacterota bacterium]
MNSGNLYSHKIPKYRVVILGAGRGARGSLPSAVVNIDPTHRVLDWQLDSFSLLSSAQIDFVAGYMANVITEQYPDVNFFFNPEWVTTGPARSLTMVPLSSVNSTYICYSDIVFRQRAIRKMKELDTDLVLAVDTLWRGRYDAASRADMDSKEKILFKKDKVIDIGEGVSTAKAKAQFTGLIKVSGSLISLFQEVIRSEQISDVAKLSDIIRVLVGKGVSVSIVDLEGDWAELDAPQDLARFVLGTKAESLQRLKPLIRKGEIGKPVSFTHAQWKENSEGLIRQIQDIFGNAMLIVRSSALSEDSWHWSLAGAYKSVPNVPCNDAGAVRSAVEDVVASYPHFLPENQVLVQQMLRKVKMSGVIMTRTPTLGAPYYVFNFDDETSRTDTVTSGQGKSIRTVILHRDAKPHSDLPDEFLKVMDVVKEIEGLVGHDSLDIEFAVTGDEVVHVLQVRPIAASHREQSIDDIKIAESIQNGILYFKKLQKRSPVLVGGSTIFSVMTDWNPAEMIGAKPNRLAFSLYRYLITDEAWAVQRAEYGYRDVRPANLIVDFLGHPYVDIRVDFNSFVPALLSDELAGRLVDYYIDHLKNCPVLHDKVEFDILYTCITFDFDKRAQRLRDAGFAKKDITLLKESLLKITRGGIERCENDLIEIKKLEGRYKKIMTENLPPMEQAYLLLEDVRRIGAPYFSHLARNAFVAVSLLKSLNSSGCISSDEMESFMESIHTVPSMMHDEAHQVTSGEIGWENFVRKYGHLRPGTYDITSVCYGNAPDKFLRPMLERKFKRRKKRKVESWSKNARESVSKEINRIGLGISFEEFDIFLRKSIEGRELGKFIFTRNVNAALEALAGFGEEHGISREQLSYMRIKELFELRAANVGSMGGTLRRFYETGRELSSVTQAVCLPGRIFLESDFECWEQMKSEANFVTRKKVQAPVASLATEINFDGELSGKIVVIPSADPGFDWLFSRNIAGLITMYGGVNSHMAVRAAEFKLPAAIGIGELLFEKIIQAEVLELDCAAHRVEIVQ